MTGTLINYFLFCKTKTWLFYHRINLEDNSEDVRIGRVLHEINEENEVSLENIKLDKITPKYVVELKKSDSDIESGKWQLLFYLYTLKQKGIIKKGKLEVVEKHKQNKKQFIIELTKDDEIKLQRIIQEINALITQPTPPKPIYKKECKKCAYYEYCFL